LSDAHAGWLTQQSALTAEGLAQWLSQRTRAELADTATRARALAHPRATERIADICEAAARS
jgi:UDP-N-acetylglucosamine--N-acetylmuramyl-(pentapeptide) pyrophosphoryl-undecaprenol N-acetylglucosamine transferase